MQFFLRIISATPHAQLTMLVKTAILAGQHWQTRLICEYLDPITTTENGYLYMISCNTGETAPTVPLRVRFTPIMLHFKIELTPRHFFKNKTHQIFFLALALDIIVRSPCLLLIKNTKLYDLTDL